MVKLKNQSCSKPTTSPNPHIQWGNKKTVLSRLGYKYWDTGGLTQLDQLAESRAWHCSAPACLFSFHFLSFSLLHFAPLFSGWILSFLLPIQPPAPHLFPYTIVGAPNCRTNASNVQDIQGQFLPECLLLEPVIALHLSHCVYHIAFITLGLSHWVYHIACITLHSSQCIVFITLHCIKLKKYMSINICIHYIELFNSLNTD